MGMNRKRRSPSGASARCALVIALLASILGVLGAAPAAQAAPSRPKSFVVVATGPDRLQMTWDFGQPGVPVNLALLAIARADGVVVHQAGHVPARTITWTGAVPGETYVVSYMLCEGRKVRRSECTDFLSTTVTVPLPTGTITGTVRRVGGAPAPTAIAAAYAPSDGLVPTAIVPAGPDGTYTFYGLPEGNYAIVAWGAGWDGLGLRWSGGARRSEAEPVAVSLGSTVEGRDIELPPTTAVTGMVTIDGAPRSHVTVLGYADGDTWMGSVMATTRSDGSFELRGITSARYRIAVVRPGVPGIVAWYGGSSRSNATWVEVGTTPATGVDIDVAT
jgi:hypothetical protein